MMVQADLSSIEFPNGIEIYDSAANNGKPRLNNNPAFTCDTSNNRNRGPQWDNWVSRADVPARRRKRCQRSRQAIINL